MEGCSERSALLDYVQQPRAVHYNTKTIEFKEVAHAGARIAVHQSPSTVPATPGSPVAHISSKRVTSGPANCGFSITSEAPG